ncbi:MAG: NAD-dependent epimerase/dehydratase family protein [Proteobacteria bacterium]|nr:NAD-dependent epimerase/dehydratase family protein [Pseudomonadota bacterium]MBU4013856.1 NAD-dependent epimerase/dehydratase family protein [Pseudomonadota bacterium]MBU4068211.1 NAD-dependent epimerase/dehydratase family protein [Pseudomonadota bacterium]MBU4126526.1 NAD-dependent epimerase/dehydratase family protein [Pseudomonadota bacterium]
MRESAADPLAAFREVNVDGTKGLAIAAANAGVKRFVYISSVKVNGEGTGAGGRRSEVRGQEKIGNKEQGAGNRRQGIGGRDQRSEVRGQEKIEVTPVEFPWGSPIQLGKEVSLRPIGAYAPVGGQEGELKEAFSEKDVPDPLDPYAVSKWEAEHVLRDVAADTGMEVVVLRPPIVYGPGVRANFLRLLKMVKLGIPLPLASIKNRRSLIYVGNLIRCYCYLSCASEGCWGDLSGKRWSGCIYSRTYSADGRGHGERGVAFFLSG